LSNAKRIPERQDHVADLDRVGVAERQRREILGVNLQQRQIARLIRSDQLGNLAAPVGQVDMNLIGAVDDMMVGQHVAVSGDDHAGSEPAAGNPRNAPLGSRNLAEKAPKQVVLVVRQSGGRHARLAFGANRHHCRRRHLDDVSV
jgi:hypothetical protein